MARDRSIAVSQEELDALKDARMRLFGTDEVPYGVVLQELTSMVNDEWGKGPVYSPNAKIP